MMTANKKEFCLITGILVVSIVSFFSIYSGSNFHASEIPVSELKCRPHNCYAPLTYDSGITLEFYKGYAYACRQGRAVYHGTADISMEPSSAGWRVPVEIPPAMLRLTTNEEGTWVNFYCVPEHGRDLPVVLLIVRPGDLFSQEDGIYIQGNKKWLGSAAGFYTKPWTEPANYFERGKNWKRNTWMAVYDEKGNYQYSGQAKMRIMGNATRSFPQKSLRLDAPRKQKLFPVFKDSVTYSSLVLRNGGNDWSKTLISDGIMQEAVSTTGMDVLHFKPCNVYINGVYWGIYSMRNSSNESFIAERYGVKKKQVTLMENWEFSEGDREHFEELKKLVGKCRPGANAEKLYNELAEMIDLDHLAVYLACQIFYANTDWPSNNIKAYKLSAEGKPDRWRFILFDLDYGMGYTGKEAVKQDMFLYLRDQQGPMARMIGVLLKNELFREKLKRSFDNLLQKELSEENLKRLIKEYSGRIRSYIPGQIERWRRPKSFSEWENNVQTLMYFAGHRAGYLQQHIRKHLIPENNGR